MLPQNFMYRSVVVGTGFKLSGNKSLRQTTGNLKTKLKKTNRQKAIDQKYKTFSYTKERKQRRRRRQRQQQKRKQIFSSSSCG